MQNITKQLLETIKRTGKKFTFHTCSICGYPCGYFMKDGQLHYDNGCDCTTYDYVHRKVTEDDLDKYFDGSFGGPKLTLDAAKWIVDNMETSQ